MLMGKKSHFLKQRGKKMVTHSFFQEPMVMLLA
jgi:hypothetical protein